MPPQPDASASAEISEFPPKELVLFAARAVRHNLGLCLLIALLISTLGSTVVAAIPLTYEATAKIFVQDGGSVTSTLASGQDRYRPIEGARALEEFILARDNLLSIVREAKLIDNWPRTRALPMRIKDQLFAAVFGSPARKDRERGFVEMLANSVTAKKDGESVRIFGQWRDQQSAYDIARLVSRNFLAARAAHDLGPIRRAIPFLEQQLQDADQEIESAVGRVHAAKVHAASGGPGRDAPTEEAKRATPANDAAAIELTNLSKQLSDARRQQRALLEPRRRRAAELKMELIDLRTQYSADHPLVRQQEARIASLNETPVEMAELRERESAILNTLASRGLISSAAGGAAAYVEAKPRTADEAELAPYQARLGAALRKSDETAARLESTRIELATAEADFKHRYVVIEEPEVPGKPLKNKKPVLYSVVLLAAFLLGALAATAREFTKGRLVEPWQVRSLGIELLGDVELKKLLPRDRA